MAWFREHSHHSYMHVSSFKGIDQLWLNALYCTLAVETSYGFGAKLMRFCCSIAVIIPSYLPVPSRSMAVTGTDDDVCDQPGSAAEASTQAVTSLVDQLGSTQHLDRERARLRLRASLEHAGDALLVGLFAPPRVSQPGHGLQAPTRRL